MDAHLFRRIAPLLAARLRGARIERIHQPLPHLTAFSLFTAARRKECLLLLAGRADPLLFLAEKNPFPNPAFPPAYIMRLRKHCEGRRIADTRLDWISRRLALAVPGEGGLRAGWLLLDLKKGPDFMPELPASFGAEPEWPPAAALAEVLSGASQTASGDSAPWRRYPVLTPALRRVLALLESPEKAALLVDLEAGDGGLFHYATGAAPLLSAWPLPPGLRPENSVERFLAGSEADLLEALRDAQMPFLLAGAENALKTEAGKPEAAGRKRRERLAAKLREEQKRLTANYALRDEALLLQANLWRFAPDARLESVSIEGKTIVLNSFLTVTENMQALFKQAARAARGLAILEKRLAALDDPAAQTVPALPSPGKPAKSNLAVKQGDTGGALKGIQEFRSSDGFILWRGRNAEGNRRALKLARPFDIWFHTEDGPSAHVILRRDHAEQVVPERTLLEAAALTALKSRYKDDAKAPVMAAFAKHVSPVKGGAAGTVRVHAVWRSFLAAPDAALETALRHDSV